ncbi:MAG TPA: hypothetical protein VEG38_17665 [Acidimicrobiia bacterium]|nr:hypothetical protein [Acidimicrobiia bacterium]
MMSGNGQGQHRGSEPVERMLDLFVHTPIGLAVLAWKRMPEMVAAVPEFVGQAVVKGCATLAGAEERVSEEVRKARMIGQVAVTFGGRQLRKEVDARLRDARQAAGGVVVSFVPGMEVPGKANGSRTPSGAGERGAPSVTATETPTAAASPPQSPAKPAAARRTPAKPTGARKAPAKATTTKGVGTAPAKRAADTPASAADLPIREYDGLSASQVVSRLTGLSPDELRAVQAYEAGSRGRRTVLVAIDRLLT